MKKYFLATLLGMAALSLAGAAAFFSITGLSKLFGGASTAVIIMASSLEFAKLVTASFLHNYWNKLKWQLKTYLTIGVAMVMIITSAGIYGFLSSAYSATSNKLQNVDSQVSLVLQKEDVIKADIKRLEENQKTKTLRINTLTGIRNTQESRLDGVPRSGSRRVENQIKDANTEVAKLSVEVDTLNAVIQRKYDQVSKYELEIYDLKNTDLAAEVGPLKYIAALTGRSMDTVVNFFILMLIFVFDPLAVTLILAFNLVLGDISKESESKKEAIVEEKPEEEEVEEEPVEEETVKVAVEEIAEKMEEVAVEEVVVEDVVVEDVETETIEPVIEPENTMVEYVDNGRGEFTLTTPEEIKEVLVEEEPEMVIPEDEKSELRELYKSEILEIKKQGIGNSNNYNNFLEAVYENKKLQVGYKISAHSELVRRLKEDRVDFKEEELQSFLLICTVLGILDMNQSNRRIKKSYREAKALISLFSL
jgi:hypothetical protein